MDLQLEGQLSVSARYETHEYRDVRFRVGPDPGHCPGIRWILPRFDHLGRELAPKVSSGGFYDGCTDHPEGAYAWARASCERYIDFLLDPEPSQGNLP